MHIAASFMTMMARPSCTTVRLFGASHCHVLPLRLACTVVVRFPRGWWGTIFPGVGNDRGGIQFCGAIQPPPPPPGGERSLRDPPPPVGGNRHDIGGDITGGGGKVLCSLGTLTVWDPGLYYMHDSLGCHPRAHLGLGVPAQKYKRSSGR